MQLSLTPSWPTPFLAVPNNVLLCDGPHEPQDQKSPKKKKIAKKLHKSRSGGHSQSRSKSRSGRRVLLHPKPTFDLLLGYFIFWGISGLVAHAGRHKFCLFRDPF